MGLFDDLKGKAQQVIGGNEEAIKDGIEKAGDFVDSKTGGKHADKIDAPPRRAGAEQRIRLLEMIPTLALDLYNHGVNRCRSGRRCP